jgi:hypothetical protein
MAKAAQERQGVIFIGLAREASCWKRFPEKVVPSDEPMVTPCTSVGSHGLQYSRWTKKPRQCTDTIHRRPVGSSGAEEHPLGVVLYVLNKVVGWTAELTSRRWFIRCWSRSFGASLYVLNATVGWTVGQGIGSSGAEGGEPWPLLLPNPKPSDELMPIRSVHPTVCFEFLGHRTHPTNVVLRASVHPTLWF